MTENTSQQKEETVEKLTLPFWSENGAQLIVNGLVMIIGAGILYLLFPDASQTEPAKFGGAILFSYGCLLTTLGMGKYAQKKLFD